MDLQFIATDQSLLTSIAEHRILTVFQMTVLQRRSANALRRRLRLLRDEGLIAMTSRSLAGGQGRPENLISLTESGVDLLKAKGVINTTVPGDHVTAAKLNCLDHEILINDFRVQLVQMSRVVPALKTRFLSPTSPLLPPCADGRPLMPEKIRMDDRTDNTVGFIPDGVFATTHEELGKTLLFFLEVDRGTEPLMRKRGSAQDVRQKVLQYQTLFDRDRYQGYAKILECQLRGFRVLFLTDHPARLVALCRLVRETPPSDFIWLTDRGRMSSSGIWAPIWARGGRDTEPLESILGTRIPSPCPSPDTVA